MTVPPQQLKIILNTFREEFCYFNEFQNAFTFTGLESASPDRSLSFKPIQDTFLKKKQLKKAYYKFFKEEICMASIFSINFFFENYLKLISIYESI